MGGGSPDTRGSPLFSPTPIKAGKQRESSISVLRFAPVILDKAPRSGAYQALPDTDEQRAVFADQGARIGYPGLTAPQAHCRRPRPVRRQIASR